MERKQTAFLGDGWELSGFGCADYAPQVRIEQPALAWPQGHGVSERREAQLAL